MRPRIETLGSSVEHHRHVSDAVALRSDLEYASITTVTDALRGHEIAVRQQSVAVRSPWSVRQLEQWGRFGRGRTETARRVLDTAGTAGHQTPHG
jgi:hypothetical protein